jgi:ribosomal protein S18 acetylase RimI-like enzyme
MIALEHRGKGLGRKVVEAVEAEILKNGGINEIRSGVQVNNTAGIAFWKRIGYETASGPRPLPDGTVVFDLRKKIKGQADGQVRNPCFSINKKYNIGIV